VGSDVSTARWDVAVRPSGNVWSPAHDEPGIAALVARREPLAPGLVVLEAPGGLERAAVAALAVAALALAGRPGAVVNPRPVRDCAKATGRWAKTAALDAAVLAHCADARRPTPRPLPAAQSQHLAALVERRRQLVGMLPAARNRAQQTLPAVRPPVQAHIAWLEQALDTLDGALDQLLPASPLWRDREHLWRGVLAELPELGQGSATRSATLVGLAPLNRASGAWRGSRAIGGGRAHVRAVRYMAAVVSVRHHPARGAYYERLLARGQPKKVAVTACRHTLLRILHALLRDRTPWQPARFA
jgi:transposase